MVVHQYREVRILRAMKVLIVLIVILLVFLFYQESMVETGSKYYNVKDFTSLYSNEEGSLFFGKTRTFQYWTQRWRDFGSCYEKD